MFNYKIVTDSESRQDKILLYTIEATIAISKRYSLTSKGISYFYSEIEMIDN